MDKRTTKAIRMSLRTVTRDIRRVRKATDVLHVLDGFGGAANGSVSDAARTEIAAAMASLRIELEHLEGLLGDSVPAVALEV